MSTKKTNKTSNNDKKIVFVEKSKYQEAVSKENNKIIKSEDRIQELRKMLSSLETTKNNSKIVTKKGTKNSSSKPKKVNGISVDQKHIVVKAVDASKYNYEQRLKDWKRKAGYNEKPHKCSKCKDECYTSILLDDNSHICYLCWIRKPTSTTQKKKK